jgi:hypothetical protein
MRNRALHDALRNFALEAAALLTDDQKAGAEVEFDVVDEGSGRGPALYRYEPRTGAFLSERWPRLRELPACERACHELGAGASAWLRVNGLRGEQAEPALQAMLERLYEDATSFGFPEERFERVYGEVEVTLYRDAVRARVIAPLRGAWMEMDRLELGDGLSIVRGDAFDGPHERSELICLLERDAPAVDAIPTEEAAERFAAVVTALRLWAPGGVTIGTPGWRQSDEGRWQPVSIGSGAPPRGAGWLLPAGEEQAFGEFFAAIDGARPAPSVAWALDRFEMGCERGMEAHALSDYLLALRGLLDATTAAGEASMAPRLAALCAEEGAREAVQRRLEAALALERFVMGGGAGVRLNDDSPRELVEDAENHLRALLRDVLCGYLEADLKGVADDILLDAAPDPFREDEAPEIEARDLRKEPRFGRDEEPEPVREPERFLDFDPEPAYEDEVEIDYEDELGSEPDTAEMDAVTAAPAQPVQHRLDGVTESADWAWDDPEDFSAPV